MDTRVGGGHRQFCLPKFAHVWLSRASEDHQRNIWIFPIFKFANRSRTTRHPFLQSFALPVKAVQLQLSRWTLRKESATRWFDQSLSSLLSPSLNHHHNHNHEHHNNTQHTETETETERQRDRDTERDQNPSITNDLRDLPQWFHAFFLQTSPKNIFVYVHISLFLEICVYIYIHVVKDTTTFETELCGCKQAAAHAHGRPHCV